MIDVFISNDGFRVKTWNVVAATVVDDDVAVGDVVAVDAEGDVSDVVYFEKKIEMETLEVIFKRQILKCAKSLSPTEAEKRFIQLVPMLRN